MLLLILHRRACTAQWRSIMHRPISWLAALLLACFCMPALAQDVVAAEDPVDRVVRIFDETWALRDDIELEEMKRLAAEAVEGLKVKDLSGVELGRILAFPSMLRHSGRNEAVRIAIEKFLDDPGPSGAAAHIQSLEVRLRATRDVQEQAEMIRAAVTHPGLEEALRAGAVRHLFMRITGAGEEALHLCREELFALERFLKPEHARQLALSFRNYHELLDGLEEDEAHVLDRERIRAKMVELGTLAAETETNKVFAKHTREHVTYLNSAFARGQLIGHAAPEITITWSSETSIKSLADLKGRVVVVDFWATWCGPCVGSFPQIRELVEHYAGYPVTVLGITSIQGRHIVWKDGRPDGVIETPGEPEREMELMTEFMRDMQVSWPIVFSAETVFNPEYGVRGIPHIVIIDPAGRVRYNELRPGLPQGRSQEDKIEKIDALLKEAGLPSPPAAAPGEAAADPRDR
jgi:thiol-disulfide isomerase/thioredoxin